MTYKNKIRLEAYKEIKGLFEDTFIDANSMQKLDYVLNKINKEIKILEQECQ